MRYNRFGLRLDPKTRTFIPKRRLRGGVKVWEIQPCKRCGVSIINGKHCACQERRRNPMPPSPGLVYAAYRARSESP